MWLICFEYRGWHEPWRNRILKKIFNLNWKFNYFDKCNLILKGVDVANATLAIKSLYYGSAYSKLLFILLSILTISIKTKKNTIPKISKLPFIN